LGGRLDQYSSDLNAAFGTNKFAVSTERDAGYASALASFGFVDNNPSGQVFSLQIPSNPSRSRSSSSSSHVSAASSHSHQSAVPIIIRTGDTVGGSSLNRANSTGQLGRGAKYKPILPRPPQGTLGQARAAVASFDRSKPNPNNPSEGGAPTMLQFDAQPTRPELQFTFPRSASANDMRQSSGVNGAGMAGPMDAESFSRLIQSSMMDGSRAPYENNLVNFDAEAANSRIFSDVGVLFGTGQLSSRDISDRLGEPGGSSSTSSYHHGRSHSFTNTFASSSLLQEPRPVHPNHGRSSSTSLLDMGRDIEFIVTPASPFNPGPAS